MGGVRDLVVVLSGLAMLVGMGCGRGAPGDVSSTLTIDIRGAGLGGVLVSPTNVTCRERCEVPVSSRDLVLLEAIPDKPSGSGLAANHFMSWSGRCDPSDLGCDCPGGTPRCLLPMDRNRTIVARFAQTRSFQRGSGLDDEWIRALDVDADGNTIVAGSFESDEIEIRLGEVLRNAQVGTDDIFIAKISRDTGTPIWARRYGGGEAEIPRGLVIDAAGDAYITGFFAGQLGTDCAIDPGDPGGTSNLFILKVSGVDGSCMFAGGYASGGGGGEMRTRFVDVDTNGSLILTGAFQDQIQLGGPGNLDVDNDNQDLLVARLDTTDPVNLITTAARNFSGQIGGQSDEVDRIVSAYSAAEDALYVAGSYLQGFDAGIGQCPDDDDLRGTFVMKLDNTNTPLWLKCMKALGNNDAYDIDILPSGEIILAVSYAFPLNIDGDPTPTFELDPYVDGSFDIGLIKLDPSTGQHVWVDRMGGPFFEGALDSFDDGNVSVVTDPASTATEPAFFVSGRFSGTFMATQIAGGIDIQATDFGDFFVARFVENAGVLETDWILPLGSEGGTEMTFDLVAADDGRLITGGRSFSDLDLGTGAPANAGLNDHFWLEITP